LLSCCENAFDLESLSKKIGERAESIIFILFFFRELCLKDFDPNDDERTNERVK
jgi:hypothetical protein